MNKSVSKTFQPVDSIDQERAAYSAIQLSAEEAAEFEPHADKRTATPRYNDIVAQPFVFLDLPGKPKR